MQQALRVWLETAARSHDPVAACTAAAEAIAQDPWRVVYEAGVLARAAMSTAPQDLGLTANLRVRSPDSDELVVRVPEGAPYPAIDTDGRKRRGAYDTPRSMAHAAVEQGMQAATRRILRGLDPACGTGAFLVAMTERGIPEVRGIEIDSAAAAVARVAAPRANVMVGDGLVDGGAADLVAGNPPFVPPERQDKALRAQLRATYPWLSGRFDLAVPFAAKAVERVEPGGGVGLVLPAPMMVQPYARTLRRRWVETHRIHSLTDPRPFPGATVEVVLLAMTAGAGPAPLPNHGLDPHALLSLASIPLDARLRPGDPELVAHIRARSVEIGTLCTVDTGVVSHGPGGGKNRLLYDTPQPGLVPYADARDMVKGQTRWLDYQPGQMHRPKSPALFTAHKVVVQRLRGRGPIRSWIDRRGLFVGHTLTVVRPEPGAPSLEALQQLINSPLTDGMIRIERGQRLDLYPRDVSAIPIPVRWLQDPSTSLEQAWELDEAAQQRLCFLAG